MKQAVAQQCDEIRNLNENKIHVYKVFGEIFYSFKAVLSLTVTPLGFESWRPIYANDSQLKVG